MTRLAERKTKLQFITGAEIRYRGKMRAVVVEIDSAFTATVRLQGTRLRYPFSWHGLHDYAADIFVRNERARIKAERDARKKARR